MSQPTTNFMVGTDAVSARLAECYLTVNDRRYNFACLYKLEAKIEKKKGTVPRLGSMMVGHKSYAMEGTFSGTMHYNTSVIRELMADFKTTGVDTYFEMQVTNEDPASTAFRQTCIFYDCNTDGGILSKFDGDPDGEYLDEDIEGTFEDFAITEDFTELSVF